MTDQDDIPTQPITEPAPPMPDPLAEMVAALVLAVNERNAKLDLIHQAVVDVASDQVAIRQSVTEAIDKHGERIGDLERGRFADRRRFDELEARDETIADDMRGHLEEHDKSIDHLGVRLRNAEKKLGIDTSNGSDAE